MKIFFDNNSFDYLVNIQDHKSLLKNIIELLNKGEIQLISSLTFISELFCLSKKDLYKYFKLLNFFQLLVRGNILLPWNILIQNEIKQKRSLLLEEKFLNTDDLIELIGILHDPLNNEGIILGVFQEKDKYVNQMNSTLSGLLKELKSQGNSPKDIRQGFKEWFDNIQSMLQSWFIHAFDITDIYYNVLPHTEAFLKYFLARHFEVINLSISHKRNDLYDRAMFIEATEADVLVTDDSAFLQTCKLIHDKKFLVVNLKELKKKI